MKYKKLTGNILIYVMFSVPTLFGVKKVVINKIQKSNNKSGMKNVDRGVKNRYNISNQIFIIRRVTVIKFV